MSPLPHDDSSPAWAAIRKITAAISPEAIAAIETEALGTLDPVEQAGLFALARQIAEVGVAIRNFTIRSINRQENEMNNAETPLPGDLAIEALKRWADSPSRGLHVLDVLRIATSAPVRESFGEDIEDQWEGRSYDRKLVEVARKMAELAALIADADQIEAEDAAAEEAQAAANLAATGSEATPF